jgi:hypothetical protein
MTDFNTICKKFLAALLEQPFLGSVFVTDFAILLFHRPPFVFSLIMLGALVAMAMYFGQKLGLFKLGFKTGPKPQTVVAATANIGTTSVTEPVPTTTPAKPKAKPKAKT